MAEGGPVLVRGQLVRALDMAVEGLEEFRASVALNAIVAVEEQGTEFTKCRVTSPSSGNR